MIVVIDYGMGNLRSVSKALESLGASARVSSDPKDIVAADKLILPGVGAFPAAMQELSDRGLIEPIKHVVASGKPYLGICLGLQLLFECSEEGKDSLGLGELGGAVKRFASPSSLQPPASSLKVPHMGWNQVFKRQETGDKRQEGARDGGRGECPLLKGVPEGSFFYFVHSYYADPADRSVIALESDYGIRFAAMVWRKNLYATQFHPEKSQAVGLQLLNNFIAL